MRYSPLQQRRRRKARTPRLAARRISGRLKTTHLGHEQSHPGRFDRGAPGRGSGVIVSADGLVLTQGHCVPEPTVKIGIPGGTEETADVLGRDEVYDLALLKLRGAVHRPSLRGNRQPALQVNGSPIQAPESIILYSRGKGCVSRPRRGEEGCELNRIGWLCEMIIESGCPRALAVRGLAVPS